MDEIPVESTFRQYWRPVLLLVFSAGVILLTAYCLQNGIQTVFTHIYYVPIILAAYWYQKKGVVFSAVLGIIYFGLVVAITGYNPYNTVAAFARVAVFIIIAAVTTVLSLQISVQQSEIERSEKKFRTIWEHVQAGIMVVDAVSHEIISVNPAAERLTGYTEKEMIGHSCHRFVCPAEKGACPISDLGMTIDHSERFLLNRAGAAVPVLKTVTAATIGGRQVFIENFVPVSVAETTDKK
ncbi:PAS domain S-box protein [Methanoregula sp.]|uniref:PAS domain S-box protein n=1 Tax=Methanoregula sp. TaxID=2052170 RepID=UPI00236977B0|nr:PAS domain S-box protein [Methanoregula sp.]MDD1686360.1 PAS domain S-box protein [Methanoregula sp.]